MKGTGYQGTPVLFVVASDTVECNEKMFTLGDNDPSLPDLQKNALASLPFDLARKKGCSSLASTRFQ